MDTKNIVLGDNEQMLPDWYLYGEKALKERVEMLKNRTNDDPFIPELVILQAQLKSSKQQSITNTSRASG